MITPRELLGVPPPRTIGPPLDSRAAAASRRALPVQTAFLNSWAASWPGRCRVAESAAGLRAKWPTSLACFAGPLPRRGERCRAEIRLAVDGFGLWSPGRCRVAESAAGPSPSTSSG